MPFALQADGSHNPSSNTNITQMDNFVTQTNVSPLKNSVKETNLLFRMKNLHTQTNRTPQLLEDSASQTNVTPMTNSFAMQTNASGFGNLALQTNVLTRLGILATKTNSTPRLLEDSASQTKVTQTGNSFGMKANISRLRKLAEQTNVQMRLGNLPMQINRTLQLLEASASQTNVTQMGNFFQTNASRANSASQTNVDVLTRLGNLALQNNSSPQLNQHSPSQANVTKVGNSAPQTNATRFGKFASAMEIDIDCEAVTYKKSGNDLGVTLEDFIYKHNCGPEKWEQFFGNSDVSEAIKSISNQIEQDVETFEVEPPLYAVFNAFKEIEPLDVKAVILGQDPTPKPGKATGLAFSLWPSEDPRDVPSVFNMLVELKLEGFNASLSNGDVSPWKKQGVMLLNSALTIRLSGDDAGGSHVKVWKPFTKLFLDFMNQIGRESAFILWGEKAKEVCKMVDRSKHYCQEGGHPSPRAGIQNAFFGGNYFKCANDFLEAAGRGKIDWSVAPRLNAPPDMLPCEQCGEGSEGPMEGVTTNV